MFVASGRAEAKRGRAERGVSGGRASAAIPASSAATSGSTAIRSRWSASHPPIFSCSVRKGIWAIRPIGQNPALRGQHFLRTVARLKPGVTVEAAQADFGGRRRRAVPRVSQTNKDRGVVVEPMRDGVIGGEVRLTALLFLGVVGFVLRCAARTWRTCCSLVGPADLGDRPFAPRSAQIGHASFVNS